MGYKSLDECLLTESLSSLSLSVVVLVFLCPYIATQAGRSAVLLLSLSHGRSTVKLLKLLPHPFAFHCLSICLLNRVFHDQSEETQASERFSLHVYLSQRPLWHNCCVAPCPLCKRVYANIAGTICRRERNTGWISCGESPGPILFPLCLRL